MALTAAREARLAATLDRTFRLGDEYTTWRDLIESDRIGYGRMRTMRDGKVSYGVIMRDSAESAHLGEEDTYAESLSRVSFYDAPKSVVDFLRESEMIGTVTITPDAVTIVR